MNVLGRLTAFQDNQYRRPSGILGWYIGRLMVRQHRPETEWTLSLLGVRPGDRVLEIGCGAGRALQLLAARHPDAYISGIDLSPTMVRSARHRNALTIKSGRVDIRQGNVMALPYPGNHFQAMFSIHSIYFWPDRAAALAEIVRVLKPGGVLVLTLSTGKVVSPSVENGPDHYILDQQLIPALYSAGLTRVDVLSGPPSRQFKIVAMVARH